MNRAVLLVYAALYVDRLTLCIMWPFYMKKKQSCIFSFALIWKPVLLIKMWRMFDNEDVFMFLNNLLNWNKNRDLKTMIWTKSWICETVLPLMCTHTQSTKVKQCFSYDGHTKRQISDHWLNILLKLHRYWLVNFPLDHVSEMNLCKTFSLTSRVYYIKM